MRARRTERANPERMPRANPASKARQRDQADDGPQWYGHASPHQLLSKPDLSSPSTELTEKAAGIEP